MSKDIWGHITWLLFHAIAEKVKPEYFGQVRDPLIQFVVGMCRLLPCAVCSDSASQHMSRVEFKNIRTSEEFKLFMFAFHNQVNMDLGAPCANIDVLDRYRSANLNMLIDMLNRVYNNQNFGYSSISQSVFLNMNRPREKFFAFFRNNPHMFK